MNIQNYLDKADELLEQNKYLDAIPVYEKAIEIDPGCSEAWLMLGSIYGETGNLGKATECIEQSLTFDAENSIAHLTLGHIKKATGNINLAIDCFKKTIICEPDNPEHYCTLAATYQQQNDLQNAITNYEKALGIDRNLEEVWSVLGTIHFQTQNFNKSEECYRTIIESNPSNIQAISNWCNSLTQIPCPENFKDFTDSSLQQNADNPEIYLQYALANSKYGKHAEAIVLVDKAISLSQGADRFIIFKADILERKGEQEDAFNILKPYLEKKPVDATAALIFAKFSHVLGLREECIKLLQSALDNETVAPTVKNEIIKAIQWVKNTDVRVDI